jgi:hypothetical protein
MELVNVPEPEPLVVLLFEVVGFWLVLQHTPFSVIVVPPETVTFPPDEAVDEVMEDIEVVVTVGITEFVAKII